MATSKITESWNKIFLWVAFLFMGSYFKKVPLSHLITCQDPGHPSVFVKNKGKKMGEILCQICYDRQWANKKSPTFI
jgi:hypothetical protein